MEPIAIIGTGCRFPGAFDIESFWQLLRQGIDAIAEVPPERWNINTFYDPEPAKPGKINSRWGGFLEQVDQFDPQFFGISPREAEYIDPQQRLMLEVTWEALENAGLVPEKLSGSQTGVFVGINGSDYDRLGCRNFDNLCAYNGTGSAPGIAANRISYSLNLRGPSVGLDTACSSSLVAVHLACQSLRSIESDLCLVGGVNLMLWPGPSIIFSQAQMTAADGRCKTFDASADGYVRGEGCGVVVLKRLEDALADGDNIQAIIRGSAVNQDGASNGLTAPNGPSQQTVIRQALKNAGVTPGQISYVEAHGTGTSLGDPIEVKSLKAVLMEGRNSDCPCWIGSVKTNIGHLEAAAGIAGLLKVVLQLQYREICPHLHLKQLNPYIRLQETPLSIPTQRQSWSVRGSRFAGVSSFGFGGTNCHVILEEAPSPTPVVSDVERPWHLLTLSAKTEKALQELVTSYQQYLENHPELAISQRSALRCADVCFSANTGRSHFNHRLAIITSDKQELAARLAKISAGEKANGVLSGKLSGNNESPKIAFLFTGQGSQYVNMGRQLYETQPVFRQTLDQCEQILQSYLEKSILDVIYPENTQELDNSVIDQTAYTQPALFAIEYALFQLWQSWGIKPDVVMGHSVGEYVAATVAGVFSLEDGLKLIAHRGMLMQQLPDGGEMVAVMASEEQVNQLIAPCRKKVAIAAINGPQSIVIAGAAESIGTVQEILEAEGVKTKQLKVSHAFHSPLMEPMLADFEAVANQIIYHQPRIPLISNVTGTRTDESITTASYWVNHVCQPVKFAQSMETLHQEGYEVFLEIGPKPILLGMGRRCLPSGSGVWLPSLRPGQEDWPQMLHSLGQLYVRGVKVDWLGFARDYAHQKVVLPTYPWQRQSYWMETNNNLLCKPHFLPNNENFHPLLGQRLHLAESKEIRFECQISQNSPTYLRHHRLAQAAIVPATAYIEMALAAGSTVFKSDNLLLEKVTIQQALSLPEGQIKTIQLILNPENSTTYSFQIFSLDLDTKNSEHAWLKHASGKVLVSESSETPQIDLVALQAEYTKPVSVENYYQKFQERGMEYGTNFQAINQLWKKPGKEAALARIQLPQSLELEAEQYKLHPIILDASFQVLGAFFIDEDQSDAYLPIKVKCLKVYRRPSSCLWSQVQLQPFKEKNKKSLRAEVRLFDETGHLVAQVEGLSLRRVSQVALNRILQPEQQEDLDNWLYEIAWQPKALDSQPEPKTKPSSWLLLVDSQEIGAKIAQQLEEQGDRSILVSVGSCYQRKDQRNYQVNPGKPEDFKLLLQESLEDQLSLRGIVHLWSLENKSPEKLSLEALQQAQVTGCGSVLHLVQAIAQAGWSKLPRLWLVTKGAQAIATSEAPLQIEQVPLWGLGRTIALEHPELQCTCLDLDPTVEDFQAVPALLQEILSPDNENQIAYRQEVRHVARLVRQQKALTLTKGRLQIPSQQPFQLKLSEYGLLDNLMLQPMERRSPGSKEVEIQVKAAGLNFRDVLNALGLLKDYYAEHLGITSAHQLTFGFECAGTIVAVGEGVSHLKVGDEVMATMLTDAFSSFVTTRAEVVVPKPQPVNSTEAATIPLTFLTAYYGLNRLAQIQPGERVLIHAAAGGVGQAAVQLAQIAGAEIIATASPAKWEFLQSMGVKHVMNSRTLDFAEQVMELTQGKGVDVIFNSLNGEFITKSFETLATGGRFVEIGKIGIWDENQVKQKRPDAQYFLFDLGEVAQQNPRLIPQMLQSLGQQFEQGFLKPLPHKVFPLEKVVEAFRYMQQGKHIGKIVVSIPQINHKEASIQAEGSYLITGGLGALGLNIAKWMAEQGAKNLVLTGRRQPSEKAQQTIEQLQKAGVKVLVLCGDISQEEDVTKILFEIEASLPTLRGVIHAAGLLDDSLLLNMNWEQFTRVMAPKVQGTWYLHSLTQNLPLDFFVCFSSIASLLGSTGQGNYTAANAFMDGLVYNRRGMGLPGLSINWGPWAEVGMASRLESQQLSKMRVQGITPINPDQGLQALAKLLGQKTSQVGVLPINWSQFLGQLSGEMKMPLLEVFSLAQPTVKAKNYQLLEQLEVSSPRKREKLLITYLQSEVTQVLGMTASQIDVQQPLNTIGLDSLMAVELRNRVQTDLAVDVPIVKFMEDISIFSLATEVNGQLTQIDRNQAVEQANNEQTLLTEMKDSNWIEVEL